jgi:uncharacterized protein
MKRIMQLVIFVSVFFLGFLALNYIVFLALGNLFAFPRNGNFFLIVVLAALFYPVAALLERTISNGFSRIFYFLAASWVGIAFFLLWGLIIYYTLTLFFKLPSYAAGIIIISVTIILSGYSILKAMHLEVKEIEVPIKGLKEKIHIVQITDIHIGPVREHKFLQKVVNTCNKQNPDLVFITGDLFDGSSQIHDEIIDTLNKFSSPVYMVTGNHDYFQGMDEVSQALKRTQINVLRNQKVQFNDLQVIGVGYSFQSGYLERSLQNIDFIRDKPSVLLYHLPRELEAAHDVGVDLQLSGHTHNGQFFPFKYVVKLQFPYVGGLYQYKGTTLYVSQGTGTWGPPMRLRSRCEVTNLHLIPKTDKISDLAD